jgi:MoaA/NifB/PqqE/SkfB family radical SAM enzyme
MNLKGIHFLLSYQCTAECDHCFVWGSPFLKGTFSLTDVESILKQAKKLKSVESVCFEGGEPFLHYPVMIESLKKAKSMGFKLVVVTNCYWATSFENAVQWISPLAEMGVDEIDVSADLYHGESLVSPEAANAIKVLKRFKIPFKIFSIEENPSAPKRRIAGASFSCGKVVYKGRAAVKLTSKGKGRKPVIRGWREFTECKEEDIENPKRVHVDPLGYVHVCQGISIGNFKKEPFSKIVRSYDPEEHPILGPLMEGGPVALAEKYHLSHQSKYRDACHFCYNLRVTLRKRFPGILAPGQMYGEGLD